jgi:hypothetical protein
MRKPRNFGVVDGGSLSLRGQVVELIREIRMAELGPHLAVRSMSLPHAHPVVFWLPNTRDPDYRARIADQCGRLAQLTSDEEAMAAAFEGEAAQTLGWR